MPRFHKVEINKTEWIVPERYQSLTPVGSGAYGQVWYVFIYLGSMVGTVPAFIFDCNLAFILSIIYASSCNGAMPLRGRAGLIVCLSCFLAPLWTPCTT